MSPIFVSVEEVLRIHYQVIEDFGGLHGIRDENRLLSVALAPQQEVFGGKQYGTLFEMAAVYVRNIICDHPFADGNKRTAITVAGIFLARNGQKFSCLAVDLEDFAVKVAVDKMTIPHIAEWLENNTTRTR